MEEETKETSPTDDFIKAKAEFKEENDRREKLIEEEKKMAADKALSGETGGNVEPETPKEDTPIEYVEKVMKGEIGDDKE